MNLLAPLARYVGLIRPVRGYNPRRLKPCFELLEHRDVPSTLSVGDVTVREGPASLGILDPSGAASVGVNGIRCIAFDTTPGHPHSGDLFVTGWMSHTVARFDWATQTYQPFVLPSDNGGLAQAYGIAIGPDGSVFVGDPDQNAVFRYDAADGHSLGTFVAPNSNGLSNARGMTFGPDGNLYVCSAYSDQILEYRGPTNASDGYPAGEFLGVFAVAASLSTPDDMAFGPDGNLYVNCNGVHNPGPHDAFIARFNGSTGAFMDTFVPNGRGGFVDGGSIAFDPLGNLYVETGGGNGSHEVLRYQGPGAPTPGAFIDNFIASGQNNISLPIGLAFGPDGNLYVSDRDTSNVTRFASTSAAQFTVTLDVASVSPVTVAYATTNGTATAGSDYTTTSGTLTFAPGETSRTVAVPVLDDLNGEPTEAFKLTLSSAVGATIAKSQGTGTVLDNETKFYVVDGTSPRTYEYGSGGTSEEITPQRSTNTAPRGVATTAAGDTVWVVDANKTVYVYNNGGAPLGSWTAGSLPTNAQLEGIATNGTDVWLLDNGQDKVYKYAGAAGRLSGGQSAASSFNLNAKNSNAKDIVTDGSSLWVVNDAAGDKVFKYTLAGKLLGSWGIDAANVHPTGITINPAAVSDIWIVDNSTLKVYQYTAAAGRTSGSQNASATFALAAGNSNPQGIADPPTGGSGAVSVSRHSGARRSVAVHHVPVQARDGVFAGGVDLSSGLAHLRGRLPGFIGRLFARR